MRNTVEAACGCHTGKIRKNNEDNFYFNGICLDAEHDGLEQILTMAATPVQDCRFAVFDGMGGESYGEIASHAAAAHMTKSPLRLTDRLDPIRMFAGLCDELNAAVLAAQKIQLTNRMGTTMAALFVGLRHISICNVGDSRVYRLRHGKLEMLSLDHTQKGAVRPGRKALLTQCLGIDPTELLIEPHIVKAAKESGDRYLLCSDGLTDMLSDSEIQEIMGNQEQCESCVSALIEAALDRGGRDNITVIICKII